MRSLWKKKMIVSAPTEQPPPAARDGSGKARTPGHEQISKCRQELLEFIRILDTM